MECLGQFNLPVASCVLALAFAGETVPEGLERGKRVAIVSMREVLEEEDAMLPCGPVYIVCLPETERQMRFVRHDMSKEGYAMRLPSRVLAKAGGPPWAYTSTSASSANSSINSRLGSTTSPISLVNISSASSAWSTRTWRSVRALASSVVSQSWSAFISPRPL